MDEHYSTINECLRLLKQSHQATSERLRIEIQLIQIKRFLLNDCLSNAVTSGAFGVRVFEDLLNSIRSSCAISRDQDALTGIVDDVRTLLAVLSSDSFRTSHSDQPGIST